MGHVRLLAILLVAATLLVDLAVVSAAVASHPTVPPEWPDPAVVALFALCMAQVGLVAIWTGFGDASLPWRVLALVLTIGLWSLLVGWTAAPSDPGPMASDWTCLLLAQSIGILVPLRAARLRDVRLVGARSRRPSRPDTAGRHRLQFSLAYLLSWITVVGLALGLAQYTLDIESILRVTVLEWCGAAVFAASHAALVVAGVWAVFGKARTWLRWVAVLLTAGAAIVVNHSGSVVPDLWPYAALCVLQLFWIAGSLSVFRVAGYRLARNP